ncbi:MAG: radical SAM protein [Acholeplasmataceae bacterium]|nr:radical SAM protein [Acholeplasmataceae bacterium]
MGRIIPVFIPHAGCPHQCIFCNQKKISGQSETSLLNAEKQIIKYLQWIKPSSQNEIAFYGGSFTALPLKLQKDLLALSDKFVELGAIGSVRVSTRPDYIDTEIVELLKHHHVTLVELGVQSLDDNVLQMAEREHSAADVEKAVACLKAKNMRIGIQLMVGLPKQGWQSLADTVKKVIFMKPDVARIYPLLVIKDTPLEKMYKEKIYSPLSMSEAVAQASYVYERLTATGIAVIRIGLQADEELCKEDNIVAGPFHPSFGEMVKAFQYRCWVAKQLEELDSNGYDIAIVHNSKITSQLKGIKKCNEDFWRRMINKQEIKLSIEDSLQEAVFKFNTSAE